jgi:hypothetical protein
MAATLVQNMACSKAAVMQAAVSVPESRSTSVSRLNAGILRFIIHPFQTPLLDLLCLALPHFYE